MTIKWSDLEKIIEAQNHLATGNPLCGDEAQIYMEQIQQSVGFIPNDRRSCERRMFTRFGPERRAFIRRQHPR